MRRPAPIALALVAVGCGGGDRRENDLRPAPPVTMTAAVQGDVVRVSPSFVGAGMIILVVANQSTRPQKVTFATDELGGTRGGRTATSPEIPPKSTGRLKLDAREGTYSVSVADDLIAPARVRVGPPRESGQDRVLLP